jgi:putative FmdB family regulatory protein
MPNYTYLCQDCKKKFEIFSSIRLYQENPQCTICGRYKTQRAYDEDMSTIFSSVKKSDSELKTIGDIANRNRDKLSNDEKIHLYNKHNEYKETAPTNELPKGMKRIKKPNKKIKWT